MWHKTVLKILVKRNKNTKNPAIKFEKIKNCKAILKNLRKSVTLSLQEIIYYDLFFFYASLTYRLPLRGDKENSPLKLD